jgi:hypothetical protein
MCIYVHAGNIFEFNRADSGYFVGSRYYLCTCMYVPVHVYMYLLHIYFKTSFMCLEFLRAADECVELFPLQQSLCACMCYE